MNRDEALRALEKETRQQASWYAALNNRSVEKDLVDIADRIASLLARTEAGADEAARWKAEYECAQQRGDMLDDLCTSNARALFRAMNPGASDDEIEYEDSHDITQQAVRALTHPHDASARGAKVRGWISDNDLLKLRDSVDDARNIRMSTKRTHLRVHPVYIPALSAMSAAAREGE